MAQACPKLLEVQEIQFRLHEKLRLFTVGDTLRNNVNLLATSSSVGLLFAANPNIAELKVFILKELVNGKALAKLPLTRTVALQNVAIVLACSADGNMLAINSTINGSAFLQIYSVASFVSPNIRLLYNIRLSPEENVCAIQLLWNPVLPGNLAAVLSNGALGMFNLKENGNFEMHSVDRTQQVKCGCWSPKGKQIVLGFPNGRLQQLKPDLTAAKTIACPPGVHPGPFDTIALHWLSTFQFAVAFLQHGPEMSPALYIVNAPKGGTPSYISYNDICYSAIGPRTHQMSFTHVPQWNLLLVASANGAEVGILGTREGGDTPTWQHYMLLGEVRIEMPLTDRDETYPVGFALDTSSSHQLIIHEKTLPVMPMVHVLSSHGHLVSYDFVNLMPGALGVCSPPPPVVETSGQFVPFHEPGQLSAAAPQTSDSPSSAATQIDNSFVFTPDAVTSTPAMKDKISAMSGAASQAGSFFGATMAPTPFGSYDTMAHVVQSTPFSAASGPFTGFGGMSVQSPSAAAAKPTATRQQPQSQLAMPLQPQVQATKPQQTDYGQKPSELNKPLYTVPPNFTPPTLASATQPQQKPAATAAKGLLSSSEIDESVRLQISVEINSFDQELAKNSSGLLTNMGNLDELKAYNRRLNDLQEINEQANDREFEMDVQNLHLTLSEACAMLAECRTKLNTYSKPEIQRVLSSSNADHINRRQLTKLQSALAANELQMQQVQNLIDEQWATYQDTVRRNSKSMMHIPCLDGVYQRMTQLKDMLSRLRLKLNHIKAQLRQKGLICNTLIDIDNPVQNKADSKNALASLADSMLSMSLSNIVQAHYSKLSPDKLNAIRSFVRNRQEITIIRPQRPDRVGLNSEVILETKLHNERKARERAAAKAEVAQQQQQLLQEERQLGKSTAVSQPLPKPTATKATVPSAQTLTSFAPLAQTQTTAPLSFNVGNASPFGLPTSSVGLKTNDAAKAAFVAPATGSSSFTAPTLSAFGSGNAAQPLTFGAQSKTAHGSVLKEALAAPISFSAKVIGGDATSASAINKPLVAVSATAPGTQGFAALTAINGAATVTPKAPGVTDKPEASAHFAFGAGEAPGSKPAFSGFATPTATTTKSIFDGKLVTPSSGNFSFSGFGNALSAAPASTQEATTSVTAATPAFSGFGPPVTSVGNSCAAALSIFTAPTKTIAPKPSSSDGAWNLTTDTSEATVPDSKQVATATPVANATAMSSSAIVSTTTTPMPATSVDPADTVFGALAICKPTSTATTPKEGDAAKPATPSIFSGFGGASSSTTGVFSFAAATGDGADKPIFSSPNSGNTFSFDTAGNAFGQSTTPSTVSAALPAVTSTAPLFGSAATTTVSITSTIITSTSAAPISAAATAASRGNTASSIFGGAASFLTPTAAPMFGSVTAAAPAATVTSSSIFGSSTTTAVPVQAGNIFGGVGGMPKPEQSVFGSPSNVVVGSPVAATGGGGLFAAAAAANPSPFSSPPATGGSIFGGTVSGGFASTPAGSIFGGATTATSPFATAATNPTLSIFGGAAKPAESGSGSVFGSPTQTATASGGSLFGQSTFGQTAPTVGGSLFGGATQQASAATAFGSSSIFGGAGNATGATATGFGSFSMPAGNPSSAFGSPPGGGSFAQGGGSVAQSGFGTAQPGSAFAKPLFGGAGAFGSPPAFGAQPSFGGAATFGSPKSFGSFAAPNTATTTPPGAGVFGGATQKNNLFEALGSTDSGISFGNLAGSNAHAPKPSFGGGTSFMNYRA